MFEDFERERKRESIMGILMCEQLLLLLLKY